MTSTQISPALSIAKDLLTANPDGLKELVRAVLQEVLEAEMTDALGAGKGERSEARRGYRSGSYPRTIVTRVGKIELRVPQDRDGRFSTELFQRYQRSEQALGVEPGADVCARRFDPQSQSHHRQRPTCIVKVGRNSLRAW